jgi:hypothetical protein
VPVDIRPGPEKRSGDRAGISVGPVLAAAPVSTPYPLAALAQHAQRGIEDLR